jgi:phenylacetate-CoA ligase
MRLRLLDRLIRWRAHTPEQMAAYAAANTKFYREFYAGHDPRAFRLLPVLRKQVVREASPYDLLAAPYRDRVSYYAETTGSTGSPTPAFFTPAEMRMARWVALWSPLLDAERRELSENRTCIDGLAFGFTIAGHALRDVLVSLGGIVCCSGSRSTLATPPRIAQALVRLKPAVVAAAPLDFLSWMRIVKEDFPGDYEATVASLKLLISTAELCARSRTERICEHFGLHHVDVYACVEGFFTVPCPCGAKHVLPAYLVELFDDDLNFVGETGTGRLAFTNLVKESTPMVRYLLDDWVTVSQGNCPYGFKLSIVPHGRYELNVRLPCGVLNVEHVEECLFRHALFGDYRVEVFDDRLTVELEQYTDAPVPIAAVEKAMAERFGLTTRVAVRRFGEMTDYRAPRGRKPILRLVDRRAGATQRPPSLL